MTAADPRDHGLPSQDHVSQASTAHDHSLRHEHLADHGQAHGHSHFHSHAHVAIDSADSEQRVLWVTVMTGAFMIAEVAGGILSGSLALLADAAHMLSDAVALLTAWIAFRVARWPASQEKSYGWYRAEVLAAFVNGLTLLILAAWIAVEAIGRLSDPHPIKGVVMGVVATLGLLINAVAALILSRGAHRHNLNLRAALLHVLGDLLGSVAAIVAAGIILLTGWTPIDPILSLLVAALVGWGGWEVVRRSAHILLEGAPEAIDLQGIQKAIRKACPGALDVHHVHLWSLSGQRLLLTLHVTAGDETDHAALLHDIQRTLERDFSISHATIQIEKPQTGCRQGACAPVL